MPLEDWDCVWRTQLMTWKCFLILSVQIFILCSFHWKWCRTELQNLLKFFAKSTENRNSIDYSASSRHSSAESITVWYTVLWPSHYISSPSHVESLSSVTQVESSHHKIFEILVTSRVESSTWNLSFESSHSEITNESSPSHSQYTSYYCPHQNTRTTPKTSYRLLRCVPHRLSKY